MEILKPNDVLVATLNNPTATPYDMLSNNITGENTSLFSKEEYKASEYIQNVFKKEDGKFDDIAFDEAYNLASKNFYQLTNTEYLKGLDEIAYSPFDITRPKAANTFKVSSTLEKEYNPFKEKYGWTGVGSVDSSSLSLRELAQQNKIFDPTTNTWSEESVNDLSILDKIFGDTLVYAQYDEDGQHIDLQNGLMVSHKKGDWKVNENGNLFIEKLSGREIYGKQVVNPLDIMTTDGSLVDQFNFLDSDGREKSMVGTVMKTAFEIAPFFIPQFGIFKGMASIPNLYGSVKAATSLMATLPTFYKSFEGLLIGDNQTALTSAATSLEGWMSKYNKSSSSDEASSSAFNFEQMSTMVGDIFSQIYEQRAAASLSQLIYRGDNLSNKAAQKMAEDINQKLLLEAIEGKIKIEDVPKLAQAAMTKIPELESIIKQQSQMSKALSLGYMALTSTGDIYGEALEGGYDRRTAGFAALAAAAGQYGIMMNNEMGTWFLDKTTGYSTGANKALIKKAIKPWFEEVEEGFSIYTKEGANAGKKALSKTFGKMKNSLTDIFTTPSIIGEAMWKNAVVEGVEEVTEQMVLDATKGIVDTMGYLGLTKKQGSFGGWSNVFSAKGAENYLANLVGGVIGGGLFEFHRSKIMPIFEPSMLSSDTQKHLYDIIADGKKDEVINIINSNRGKFGNKYITPFNSDGTFGDVKEGTVSQADFIADKAIEMVNLIDGILNSHDLIHTDDEIVNKAIMDKIIIDDLKKTVAEKGQVGLEGLVLKDYKNKVQKIVNLEGAIRKLEETPENQELKKQLTHELSLYLKDIEEIKEGKKGSIYYKQAMFYLNKSIHSAFLNVSKTDFTKELYEVNYADLPEKGLGLSKERIDKEWETYKTSTDFLSNLEVAEKIFSKVANDINSPIVEYGTTGYDLTREQVFNNTIDLQKTIELFNVTSDEEGKNKAFKRIIELNNTLKDAGIIAPWTSYHNDIFDQLFNLGLVKKVNYNVDSNNKITEEWIDFEEGELDSTVQENITKRDIIKGVVSDFFKQFPSNPLTTDVIIKSLNDQISSINGQKLKEINELELLPVLTEEQSQKLTTLKESLYEFKIADITTSKMMEPAILNANSEIDNILKNYNINADDLKQFEEAQIFKTGITENFETLISSIVKTTWKELDRIELLSLINLFIEKGFLVLGLSKLAKTSENAGEVIENAIGKLINDSLSEIELSEIKSILEPLIDTIEKLVNTNYVLLTDTNLIKANKEITKIKQNLEVEINNLKPELFKLHNYALDLLIKALQEGNADKELYIEAEILINEEIVKVLSALFSESKNISYEEFQNFTNILPQLLQQIETEIESDDLMVGAKYSKHTSLSEIIRLEEESIAEGANNEPFFLSPEVLNFIKYNFNTSLSLDNFNSALLDLEKNIKFQESNLKRIENFYKLASSGITLKTNPLYDFIRKFSLTLDSNPNNKVNKIFEILQAEELLLKSSSNITNYLSDTIREQDLKQAIGYLKIIKAVIRAMSTTTVNLGDPYGFIQSIQNYAKKYNQEDDILNLKTITSDLATLMEKDIDIIITKLSFLYEFAGFNAGKMMNEQELIRTRTNDILLDNWKIWISKMNPSFLPIDKIKEVLASTNNASKKIFDIENLVFEHNIGKQEEALTEMLKHFSNVNSDQYSRIDKEVKFLEDWELAIYMATVLGSRAGDFDARSWATINSAFSKAPFYTQELVARIVKASTANPKLFSKIYELKKNSNKIAADFITIILGSAGSGKTSAALAFALDNFRQTNEVSNVWLSAPAEGQVKNLENAVLSAVGPDKFNFNSHTKNALFNELGISKLVTDIEFEVQNLLDSKVSKKYLRYNDKTQLIELTDELLSNEWIDTLVGEKLKTLPNLLLIDEVTHYSFYELFLLNAISKKSFEDDSLTFMKIVATGDQNQLGYLAKINNNYYNYNVNSVNAIFTPRLWTSVRAANTQKRLNDDRWTRVSQEIEQIYKNNPENYDKAKVESLEYLKNTQELNTLSYYESNNTLAGDRIINELDKTIVLKIANLLKLNPNLTIGILTADGTLPEEWNRLFSDAGIIDAGDSSRLALYHPGNVQGRETDLFIFDAGLISKFDKIRENIKAFNTFKTRSKLCTFIVDKENVLQNYYISNGKFDNYSIPFDPLTADVIQKAKDVRNIELKTLLGDTPTPSTHDNFKWKTAETSTTPEENIIGNWFVDDNKTEDLINKEDIDDEEKYKKNTKDGFKIMLHSFYNNPSTAINNKQIIVDNSNPPFDLNVSKNVSNNSADVIAQWLRLKNNILHSEELKSLISSDYEQFFKYAFPSITSPTQIHVEKVLTITKFDKKINTPYKKHGLDPTKTLKNGQLLINYTAKLTYENSTDVHYITLATFGTLDQIKTKMAEYGIDTTQIDVKYKDLEKELNKSKKSYLVLSFDELKGVNFITGTRLEKIKAPTEVDAFKTFIELIKQNFPDLTESDIQRLKEGHSLEHPLSTLEQNFPGANISTIKFYPNTFDEFKNLMNRYTFGEPRSDKLLWYLFDRILTDEKGIPLKDDKGNYKKDIDTKTKKPLSGLKQKPYIIISYKNDLDGSTQNNTHAALIPISAHARKLPVLISEVNKLLEERKQELSKKEGKVLVLSDELNAKTEALLNKSDILDVLIKWELTKTNNGESYLDLLFKDISFTWSDKVLGTTTSIFDIFSRFKNTSIASKSALKDVILEVKKIVANEAKSGKLSDESISRIKRLIIPKLHKKTGWQWTFFNIFGYEHIIDSHLEHELVEFIADFGGTTENIEAFINSTGNKEMMSILKSLLSSVNNKPFYYSIPIKAGKIKGTIEANSFVGGQKGFTTEFFGDKFYISATPESGRLLFDLNEFLNSTTTSTIIKSTQPTQSVLPEISSPPINNEIIDINEIIEPESGKLLFDLNEFLKSTASSPPINNEIIDTDEVIEVDAKSDLLLIKEVSKQFENEQRQQDVELVLSQVAPFIGADFIEKLTAVLTPSFSAVGDKQKAEKLLNGLNLLDKGIVSFKVLGGTLNLGTSDMELLRSIATNINTMLKNCK